MLPLLYGAAQRNKRDMNRKLNIGIKLFVSSTVFLSLTIVAAFAVRGWLQSPAQGREPASLNKGVVFEHRGALSASELGVLGSTLLSRGRKVVFNDDIFRERLVAARVVTLNLFPDLTLNARFQDASAYTVNEQLFIGQIEGDEESTVRIMIVNQVMDGTIRTNGREFRIFDGSHGQHFITEALIKR